MSLIKLTNLTLPGPRDGSDKTFSCRELVDGNIDRLPIFLINQDPWLETLADAYTPWAVGLADQLLPNGTQPPLEEWIQRAEASFGRFDGAAAARLPEGTYESTLARNYWKHYQRYGFDLVSASKAHANDPAVLRTVIRGLERLAERHRAPSPKLFKNLGLAYWRLSGSDPRAIGPMIEAWRRYLSTDTTADPDRGNIRIILEQAERTLGAQSAHP